MTIPRYVLVNGKRRRSPEYAAWADMCQRCTNPKGRAWPRYGGRGIKVCDSWLGRGGFDAFIRDMGPRPKGASLDRINNDGHYEPDNCRWASEKTQQRNKRDNRLLTIGNQTLCLADWAERHGLPRRVFASRLTNGWDPAVALNTSQGMSKATAHKRAGVAPAREGRSVWGRSGYRGVHRSGRGWCAIIKAGKKQRYLGTFDTPEEAARAYDDAARKHHSCPVLNYPVEPGR